MSSRCRSLVLASACYLVSADRMYPISLVSPRTHHLSSSGSSICRDAASSQNLGCNSFTPLSPPISPNFRLSAEFVHPSQLLFYQCQRVVRRDFDSQLCSLFWTSHQRVLATFCQGIPSFELSETLSSRCTGRRIGVKRRSPRGHRAANFHVLSFCPPSDWVTLSTDRLPSLSLFLWLFRNVAGWEARFGRFGAGCVERCFGGVVSCPLWSCETLCGPYDGKPCLRSHVGVVPNEWRASEWTDGRRIESLGSLRPERKTHRRESERQGRTFASAHPSIHSTPH